MAPEPRPDHGQRPALAYLQDASTGAPPRLDLRPGALSSQSRPPGPALQPRPRAPPPALPRRALRLLPTGALRTKTGGRYCLTRLPQAPPAYGRSSTQGAVVCGAVERGNQAVVGEELVGHTWPWGTGGAASPKGEAEAGGAVAAYTEHSRLLIPTCAES